MTSEDAILDEAGKHKRKLDITLQDYIQRFDRVHNNKYDYSKISNFNPREHIKVLCPSHGYFKVKVFRHLKAGGGCPTCKNKVTTLIARIKATHRSRDYIYGAVKWGMTLAVTCPTHGEFTTSLKKLQLGKYCPICTSEERTALFIRKFSGIHGSLYNYDLVSMPVGQTASTNVVDIVCSRHGIFSQEVRNHLKGCGCPKCSKFLFQDKPTTLYYIKVTYQGTEGYKIGITTDTVKGRYRAEKGRGVKIKILKEVLFDTGKSAWEREQAIIKASKAYLHPYPHELLLSGYSELYHTDILKFLPNSLTLV